MWMIMDKKADETWKQGRWTTPYELHNDIDVGEMERTLV